MGGVHRHARIDAARAESGQAIAVWLWLRRCVPWELLYRNLRRASVENSRGRGPAEGDSFTIVGGRQAGHPPSPLVRVVFWHVGGVAAVSQTHPPTRSLRARFARPQPHTAKRLATRVLPPRSPPEVCDPPARRLESSPCPRGKKLRLATARNKVAACETLRPWRDWQRGDKPHF